MDVLCANLERKFCENEHLLQKPLPNCHKCVLSVSLAILKCLRNVTILWWCYKGVFLCQLFYSFVTTVENALTYDIWVCYNQCIVRGVKSLDALNVGGSQWKGVFRSSDVTLSKSNK